MKLRLIFSFFTLFLLLLFCQKNNTLIASDVAGNSKQMEIEQLLFAHGFKKIAVDNKNAKQGKRIDNYRALQEYLSSRKIPVVGKWILKDPTDPSGLHDGILVDSSFDSGRTTGAHTYEFANLIGTFPADLVIQFDPSDGDPVGALWHYEGLIYPEAWSWNYLSSGYLGGNVYAFLTLLGGFDETISSGSGTYIQQWGIHFSKTYDGATLEIWGDTE